MGNQGLGGAEKQGIPVPSRHMFYSGQRNWIIPKGCQPNVLIRQVAEQLTTTRSGDCGIDSAHYSWEDSLSQAESIFGMDHGYILIRAHFHCIAPLGLEPLSEGPQRAGPGPWWHCLAGQRHLFPMTVGKAVDLQRWIEGQPSRRLCYLPAPMNLSSI